MKNKTNTFKHLLAAALTIAALAAGHNTAWAQDPATIGSITYNSTLGAYEINSANNLHDLAVYVNGTGTYSDNTTTETTAHDCTGLTFKVTADITIAHSTEWDDANSTEANYTAIGGNISGWKYFKGTFDGQHHTVSGIRINSSTIGQGLFGAVQNATIKDVNVSDIRIQGKSNIGTVAASISSSSTVSGCQVMDAFLAGEGNVGGVVGNVSAATVSDCHASASVTVQATKNNASSFGGVVGANSGSSSSAVAGIITGCTSSATLTIKDGITGCKYFGGIVGNSASSYTTVVEYCRALGVTVPATTENSYDTSGAIAGYIRNATLTDNYYLNCNVAGMANAVNIGIGKNGSNTSDHTGGTHSLHTITLDAGLSVSGTEVIIGSVTYYPSGTTVTLGGGTGYTVTVDDSDPVQYVQVTETSGVYTFTMPSGDITVSGPPDYAGLWHADDDHDGTTAGRAYIITTAEGLNLLASEVNNGNNYSGKFFKLGDDITYTHTTDWDDATSTENNYVAIGKTGASYYFSGTFDGCGHTVSGIRIYKGGEHNQGLFGMVRGGKVKNVTLTDARITGKEDVGGIVGANHGGTVENCIVANNVTIHAAVNGADYHGGIVGLNSSTGYSKTIGCISSAQLTISDGLSECDYWGGIVGWNNGDHTEVTNCFATGVTVGLWSGSGAIVGENRDNTGTKDGTLSGNYYTNCNVDGNASNIGVGHTTSASHADHEGAKGVGRITLGEGVSISSGSTVTVNAVTYYLASQAITLSHGNRAGYAFVEDSYSVKDADGNTEYSGVTSFTMPAYDVTVTAEWTANASLALSATSATIFGEAKYVTTFYHGTLDYELPEGVKVYTASLDGAKVVFRQVGDDGSVIPHGTAVIVVADAASITLTKLASTDVTAHAGNILQGSDTAVTVTAGKVDDKVPYVLNISSEVLGFYKFNGSTIPAGKAYYLKSE